MNVGWNFRREHLRLQQRSHYVITKGGDQPNVVPRNASVWYFLRETDYARIVELRAIADRMAQGAALMTNTEVDVARDRQRLAAALQPADRRGDAHQHQGGRPAAVGRGRPDAGARRAEGAGPAARTAWPREIAPLVRRRHRRGQLRRRLGRHRRRVVDGADGDDPLPVEHPGPARPPLVERDRQRHADRPQGRDRRREGGGDDRRSTCCCARRWSRSRGTTSAPSRRSRRPTSR